MSPNARGTASDPLAIRGAARPTVAGRLRRKDADSVLASNRDGAVDAWRQMVNARYNPETRFLDLSVCTLALAFFICLPFIANAVNDRRRNRQETLAVSARPWW